MRKLSLILAAFIFAATTWAQNGGELTTLAEKTISVKSTNFDYLYGDTTSIVFKEANTRSIFGTMGGHLEIARYDKNLNEVTRSSVDIPVNCKYITGFNNKEGIDILLSEKNEEGTKINVYHEHLSPTTLEPVGERITLGTLTGEKTDNMGFICRQSPDMMLTAGIFVTQREGQGAEARVVLYDRKFEEYWSMTTRLRVVDFASVTDNGEVIIGGFRPQAIPDVDLAGWRDGKLYLLAIGRKKKSKDDNGSHADRVVSICYNTVSDKVTSDSYTFSKEEIERMNNKGNLSGTLNDEIRFLGFENAVEAPDGHYDVLLTQTWTVVSDYGTSQVSSGIMIVTLQPNGTVKRVYTHPYDACSNIVSIKLAKKRLLRTNGGSLLLYSQHKKNVGRKPSKKVKIYAPGGDKAVLTALFIPDDSEVIEKHFPTEKFSLINTPILMDNNKYLFFFP